MSAERSSYDASTPDWAGLAALAKRAAAETTVPPSPPLTYESGTGVVEACGPHWLIGQREHNTSSIQGGMEEQAWSKHHFVLNSSGVLEALVVTRRVMLVSATLKKLADSMSHRASPLSDGDLASIDFGRAWYERQDDWGLTFGDYEPGTTLLTAARGGVLAECLGSLVKGVAPSTY